MISEIAKFYSVPADYNKKTTWKKAYEITKLATKVAGSILALSAVFYSTGSLLVSLSEYKCFSNISANLLKSGHICHKIGKVFFLVVGVPCYSTFYQLPKWVVQTAIPTICRIGKEYIEYIAKGIEQVFKWTCTQLGRFFHWVYIPIEKIVLKALSRLKTVAAYMENLLIPVFEKIAIVFKSSCIWMNEHFLIPIGKFLDKAIRIVGKIIEYGFTKLETAAIKTFNYMKNFWCYVRNQLFIPLCTKAITLLTKISTWGYEKLVLPISKYVDKVFIFIGDFFQKSIEAIIEKVLVPAFHTLKIFFSHIMKKAVLAMNLLEAGSIWVGKKVVVPFLNLAIKGIVKIYNVVMVPARLLYSYALLPSAKGITFAVTFATQKLFFATSVLYNKFLIPIAQITGEIFTSIIEAITQTVSHIFIYMERFFSEMKNEVVRFMQWAFSSINHLPMRS